MCAVAGVVDRCSQAWFACLAFRVSLCNSALHPCRASAVAMSLALESLRRNEFFLRIRSRISLVIQGTFLFPVRRALTQNSAVVLKRILLHSRKAVRGSKLSLGWRRCHSVSSVARAFWNSSTFRVLGLQAGCGFVGLVVTALVESEVRTGRWSLPTSSKVHQR